MAVNINKQNSPAGSPLFWFALLALAGGGAFYYYRIYLPAHLPVVAEAPPEPPPPPPPQKKEESHFVELEPPKEVPKVVTPVAEETKPEPEKPKAPRVPYTVAKDSKPWTPKLGKGPDKADLQMWEIMASPAKPYRWDKDTGKALGPAITAYMHKDPKHTVAHPGAKDFPGAVPADAPRIQKVVRLPLSRSRWQSTGLYAPPGETIRVELPPTLKGGEIIIGCHRDNIANSERKETHRFPLISTSVAITKTIHDIANPFGGLIYISVPEKKEWEKTHATARVEINGGVECPLFILGETTKEEWDRLRASPAPWGEIGSARHFAAARSERFRDMDFDTAKALAEYWDKAVELEDWLCGRDTRRSPERMVPDAEITIGSGHSGYPYMGYLDWEGWTDLKKITTEGSWGHYHELGHNHQSSAWTFAGYGEVTNNVMGLLCEERLADIKLGDGRGWLGDLDAALAARLGPPPKEDARGNLAMYVPVIRSFGWETLRDTWAEYAKKGNRPSMNLTTDDKKKETFVVIWSKHCKANLGPYFECFGFPYTPSMKFKLSSLKAWMPPSFPPKPSAAENARTDTPLDHGAEIQDVTNDN